jgi:hypothetical protein
MKQKPPLDLFWFVPPEGDRYFENQWLNFLFSDFVVTHKLVGDASTEPVVGVVVSALSRKNAHLKSQLSNLAQNRALFIVHLNDEFNRDPLQITAHGRIYEALRHYNKGRNDVYANIWL